MKISEILRKAADRELWDGVSGGCHSFSCCAVLGVNASIGDIDAAISFLRQLGVDTNSGTQFNRFHNNEKRQGARFLWLDFAALVAEDEGL